MRDPRRSPTKPRGVNSLFFRLSLRAPSGQHLGDDAQWAHAEDQLRSALTSLGLRFREAPGEAAFYGPKIDVQVIGANGREETLSTVQVDYNQPERFDLGYVGEDGKKHRPVMIHRGLLSSMERMTALLVETYQRRMPTWLAPVQVRLLPVSAERHDEAARALQATMRAVGIRAEVSSPGTLGNRIREARATRDTYLVVLGDSEVADGTASVVVPGTGEKGTVKTEVFVEAVVEEIRERRRAPGALGTQGGAAGEE